jgi:hypothetical protein
MTTKRLALIIVMAMAAPVSVNAQPDTSVNSVPARAIAQDPPSAPDPARSATRKGFIIGAGAGAGLQRSPDFSGVDRFGRFTVEGGSSASVATNFMVGYAPTDHALLFYSSRAVVTSNAAVDILVVGGLGMTYMLRRTAPTAYVTSSIGRGVGVSINGSIGDEDGFGWSGGAGWEFRRHFSLEGDVLNVRLGNGQNHTAFRALLNYTFY